MNPWRLYAWFKIVRHLRGTSLKTQFGLFLSAIIDVLRNIMFRESINLMAIVTGIFYSKTYNVYFYVRSFTDDLHSIMPNREKFVSSLIFGSLSEGDTFIDVGANIGYYSLIVSKIVGEDGRVYAFEPMPTTARVLRFNAKLNGIGNIRIVQKAVCSKPKNITMYVPQLRGVSWFGSSSMYNPRIEVSSIHLEGTSLDVCLSSLVENIKIMKIDVEGAEYEVLCGAEKILERTEKIILEVSRDEERIVQLLESYGFKIQKLGPPPHIYASKGFIK